MSLKINNRVYNDSAIINIDKKIVGVRKGNDTKYGVFIVHINGQEKIFESNDIEKVDAVFSELEKHFKPIVTIEDVIKKATETIKNSNQKEIVKEEVTVPKKRTRRKREVK